MNETLSERVASQQERNFTNSTHVHFRFLAWPPASLRPRWTLLPAAPLRGVSVPKTTAVKFSSTAEAFFPQSICSHFPAKLQTKPRLTETQGAYEATKHFHRDLPISKVNFNSGVKFHYSVQSGVWVYRKSIFGAPRRVDFKCIYFISRGISFTYKKIRFINK